jgi:predicted aspartyl protease
MKATTGGSLLGLMSLTQNVLAANVVHLTIAKTAASPNLARRDFDLLNDRATVEEKLYNNLTGGSYMANVTVGTPGQEISLVIDTGSSDVFVLSSTADQCTDAYLQQTYGPCSGGTCK